MDDLHKPLGQNNASGKQRSWLVPGLLVLATALLSLGAYVFIDSRPEKTVVAINTPQPNTPAESLRTGEADPSANNDGSQENLLDEDGNLDLSKVKPLSPLEPIDEEDGAPDAPQATPSFTPRPVIERTNSDWTPMVDLVEQSEFGPLPRISDGRIRPLDVYSKSSGTIGGSRVAIIIGGLGLSQTGTQKAIADLPSEITLGFSPFGNSLQRWMQTARREGHETILQLPMEPLGYPTIDPGPRTLTSQASEADNRENLHWSMARMTNYPLVMNYLGAGLSNKPQALLPILREIKARGLGYIDDGSVQASTALQLAKEIQLPHAKGTIVLDKSREAEAIKGMLTSLESVAKATGFAIGTATAFPETVKVIEQWAKDAPGRGILIVPASNLLKDYSIR